MSVIELPGKGGPKEGSPEALKQALAEMRERLPFWLDYAEIQAKIARTKYKVLVANGFTEQQAIELLKGTI